MGITGDDASGERRPVEDGGDGPTWDRLEDQLGWYDRKSAAAQQAYKRVKLGQLIVGAAVPVVAALQVSAAVTATLAAFVVVAEGAQQLYQWQTNWVLYRSTAEALKHEKYLYLAAAGPYSTDDRDRVLAERLEGLVSQEHAKWTESRQKENQTSPVETKRH
ncbi:MAG: DUF4231 domain-containing protein [Pseudonocardiales bacterium]|nr:DUF4231 domain-containing protein [Pseudonocardiales bacterium]MBV9730415.1 DUF4231 domain-containing protein [Pseudonocardiales bacterium]